MKRFITSAILACALISIATLFPARAGATCMESCIVKPVSPECESPLDFKWPANVRFSFIAACGGCCWAGPGSRSCTYDDTLAVEQMKITLIDEKGYEVGGAVAGTFSKTDKTCNTIPVFEFDGELQPGNYILLAGWDSVVVNIVEGSDDPEAIEWFSIIQEKTDVKGLGDHEPYDPDIKGPPPQEEKRGGCASCTVGVPAEDRGSVPWLFILLLLIVPILRRQ